MGGVDPGSGRVGGGGVGGVARLGGDPPSPYEVEHGFSRVVSAGQLVIVGGTTSVNPDGAVLGDTPYEQTVEILGKVSHELGRAGAGVQDVISVRVYVTDISRGAEVGRAYAEVFSDVRPVMTMVEVSGLIDPRMLVEIEVVAYR
jgi:enamine deaminase RidA (YjgF/YER057c/UK114 family)